MGKYYPNVNPGEIVPGGFTYPNNAKLQGDFLYLRDANKNMVSGRQVDDGDSITVLDVGYSQQLALVQYPTSAGVRQGYVNNTPSVIKYNNANAWANGSTTEIVYDENGGQLGSLSPYESATPLYKKNGMTHVVYNTDKGPNTKSGYVKYEGGSVTKITIPKPSTSGVSTISYGKSGKERDLTAYKIGNGNNSLVMVCEVHGFEDNFPKDGLELVNIGNDLIRSLASNGTKGWSVYVIPAANPDGLAEGYTNYGPGRCTMVGGVDINRDFPIGFTPHGTSRNWTGDKPLSVNESSKLSQFIQGIKNKTSGKMVVIDLHGWEGAAIGNPEIGQYFRNQFGFEQRSGYGADKGFLIAWAKSIGADAALIELPKNTHSHSDVINGGYSQKVISAVNRIIDNNDDIADITGTLKDLMVRYEYMYRSSWANNSPIENLYKFYTLVRNKGKLDLKNQGWTANQYKFNGVIIPHDAPGNILYGYLGKAFGYSDELLKRAAGFAQHQAKTNQPEWGTWSGDFPYGDDPVDQFFIQLGIQYYKQNH